MGVYRVRNRDTRYYRDTGNALSVADLKGAETAPPLFGRRTDAVTQGHVS